MDAWLHEEARWAELGMKYAETAFTRLNYSIPEHVHARLDLMVTAQGEFKIVSRALSAKGRGSSES